MTLTGVGGVGLEPAAPAWQVLADGRAAVAAARPPGLRRTVVSVLCASALALVCLLLVASYAGRRAAEVEALRDVRVSTELVATAVLAPALDDAALRGDPAALRDLDALVRERVLVDPVVRLKVWTPDGRIVYSDDPALIGQVHPLDETELTALDRGATSAGPADLGDAEHRDDGLSERALEVYTPVRSVGGRLLLVETYSRQSLVTDRQAEVLRTFLPITVTALVLLQLCQLPLAWSMVRRLRAGQRERERLLQQAIQASDDERRRVAGDLHDTVVQGLVGASYVLSAVGERLDRGDTTGVGADVRSCARSVRESVRGLRTLLLEIYPAHVARAGLPAALADLTSPLRAKGIDLELDVEDRLDLRRDQEALVFRTAQEALRNVARHSSARRCTVRVQVDGALVVLLVEDDGVGFDVEDVLRRDDGHVGLRVLQGLVEQAGCGLSVSTTPGRGTRLRLEVPRS